MGVEDGAEGPALAPAGVVHDTASALPGTVLTFPFEDRVAGYKLGGRLFAICVPAQHPTEVTLRAETDTVVALSASHASATPGELLGGDGWVKVTLGGDIDDELVAALVAEAWRVVGASLPGRTAQTLLDLIDSQPTP